MANSNDELRRKIELQEKINALVDEERQAVFGISNEQKKLESINRQIKKNYNVINRITDDVLKTGRDLTKEEEKQLKLLGKHTGELEKQIKKQELKKKLWESIKTNTLSYLEYLMQSDKAIRQANLNLGLSGKNAERLRKNFEDSAVQLAYLGSNLQELSEMQTTYSDLTGRQTLLYKDAAIAATQIAKGTSLGAQGAGELLGNMELVGTNAEDTAKMVQNVVDSSEKFGVNSNKILKTMNTNFKRFASYGFKTGVAGMSDMAMYSEKFKVSMQSTLNAADKARTLEGAVELASKLQVLGGEFAKTDPFKMLYESRNDPKKFMQSINEMTKGMASLRKTSEGFEFDLTSPQSRDVLAKAAEALGMSTEELTEQAIQMSKIQEMRRQLSGSGILNTDDRELIEGMAQFEKNTGKFYVMVNDQKKELSKLNKTEIEGLKSQKTSLEDRAKAAQNFDEQLKATVEGLKAALLPMLKGINQVLDFIAPIMKTISGVFDSVPEWGKKLMGGTAALLLGAVAIVKSISGIKSIGGVVGKGVTSAVTQKGGSVHSDKLRKSAAGAVAKKATGGGVSENMTKQMKKIDPKTILAAGAAMMMFGAGIAFAALGIGKMSESLKNLNTEQLDTLKDIMTKMTIMFGVFAVGLTIVGTVAGAVKVPMLAFGGAVLMIGAGVGIAAAGIGYMAEGMSSLMKAIDPNTIVQSAIGIAGIASSLMILSTTGLIGLLALTGVLKLLSMYGSDMERIGNAFKNIGTVLSADASNFTATANAIKTIASADVSNNSALSQLAQMFNKPLKVEFDKKEVALNVNTVINMDGRVMASNMARQIADVSIYAQKGRA